MVPITLIRHSHYETGCDSVRDPVVFLLVFVLAQEVNLYYIYILYSCAIVQIYDI